jgi:nicotinamidase-related amidase
MANIQLLIIDPQNDFCDLPEDYRPALPGKANERCAPALPVTGAHADMLRVADLIERGGDGLAAITVTLDSHQRLDIAHPTFWQQADGSPVGAFTQILAADVRAKRYLPRDPSALPRVLAYLDALEAAGRYTHMVWPVHCEIGSWGQNVQEDVRRAYNRWEEQRGASVGKVCKGSNPWTEHYSALKAEVPDADDAATQLNHALIERLQPADRLLIVGEAGSHCVKASTEHLVENLAPSKLVLLTDCMSPVSGFEPQYAAFIEDMRQRGVQIATAAEILPELLANGAQR